MRGGLNKTDENGSTILDNEVTFKKATDGGLSKLIKLTLGMASTTTKMMSDPTHETLRFFPTSKNVTNGFKSETGLVGEGPDEPPVG